MIRFSRALALERHLVLHGGETPGGLPPQLVQAPVRNKGVRLQVQIETALKNLKRPERLRSFFQKIDHLKHLAPYATGSASPDHPKRMDSEEAALLEWQRLRAPITE
jgi:hypothetical protein